MTSEQDWDGCLRLHIQLHRLGFKRLETGREFARTRWAAKLIRSNDDEQFADSRRFESLCEPAHGAVADRLQMREMVGHQGNNSLAYRQRRIDALKKLLG